MILLVKFSFHAHICNSASSVCRKYSVCYMDSLESTYTSAWLEMLALRNLLALI